MKRLALSVALGVGALLGCGDPTPRTEVVVVLSAEPGIAAAATRLSVRVYATDASGLVPDATGAVVLPGGAAVDQTLGSNASPVAFPVNVALVPLRDDATRRYLVEAEAIDASGAILARVRAISGYLRRRTVELHLTLEDACNGVLACASGQTCTAGSCASAVVSTDDLVPYGPAADGGVQDGADAATTGPRFVLSHYVKTSLTSSFSGTGSAVDLEGDLMVLGLPGDATDATGINPSPGPGAVSNSGAVVVLHRDPANGRWSEEAFIKPECNAAGYRFGAAVALSGDMLAVGVPGDDSVNSSTSASCGTINKLPNTGAVYIYRRDSLGHWTRTMFLKSIRPQQDDYFGAHLDFVGSTLAVGVPDDDSGWAYGSNGGADPWYTDGSTTDVRVMGSGSVFLYGYDGNAWSFLAHLKAHAVDVDDHFGGSVSIDPVAGRIVVGADGEDGNGRAVVNVGPFPGLNSRPNAGAAYVFEGAGSAWTEVAYLKGSRLQTEDGFGSSVAIHGDLIAIAAPGDDAGGTGVNPPASTGGGNNGAVYLFAYAGGWAETDYLKPMGVVQLDDAMRVALADGVLAVGYPLEDSTSAGVDSISNAASNPNTTNAGAVFVYRRSPAAVWSLASYVKAPAPRAGDEFGVAVALSSTGELLVGADGEDGSGTMLDAPVDTASNGAGAAYLYAPVP